MIRREKIKCGLFFTLPCEWSEEEQRYMYVLDERQGQKLVHFARSTNVLFRVEEQDLMGDAKLVQVAICDYDFVPFIGIGLETIAKFGTEVNVDEEDKNGILEAYFQAEKVYYLKRTPDMDCLNEENKLKIMLNNFFNRDFRNRYNQKRIGE